MFALVRPKLSPIIITIAIKNNLADTFNIAFDFNQIIFGFEYAYCENDNLYVAFS